MGYYGYRANEKSTAKNYCEGFYDGYQSALWDAMALKGMNKPTISVPAVVGILEKLLDQHIEWWAIGSLYPDSPPNLLNTNMELVCGDRTFVLSDEGRKKLEESYAAGR